MSTSRIGIGLLIATWLGCAPVEPRDADRDGGPASGQDEEEEETGEEDTEPGDAGAPPADDDDEPAQVSYGPFGEPQVIAALAAPGYDDDDPTVTGDRLELYFDSDRPGGAGMGDIYVSTRPSPSSPWGAPSLVAGINSGSRETTPEVSRDGLRLHFSSARPGGLGGLDIYMCTRPNRSSPWSTPVAVTELNSTANDTSPVTNGDNTDVIFTSTRDGGDNDLYESTRSSPAVTWTAPAPLTAINTPDSETDPNLSPDGLTLYFAAGPAAQLDIRRTTRPAPGEDFRPPKLLDALNSAANDADPWVGSRDRLLLMTSNRSGDDELYEARRVVLR